MRGLKNTVILTGNIGNDPEVREVNGKKFARMNIATDDSYKDKSGNKVEQTDWHYLTCWGNTAEIVAKYICQGDRVSVGGKLKTRKWIDKEGNKRFTTEVLIDEILMHGNTSMSASQTSESKNLNKPQQEDNEEESDEDTVPF